MSKQYQDSTTTGWSQSDGTPPEWWEKEHIDNGDVVVELNGFNSVFSDDPTADLDTRLWGAILYARELRLNGPDHLLSNCGNVHRALYGYCVENAAAVKHVLNNRGFTTRSLAVMTKDDIRQCLDGERPNSVTETSFRHYLVQVRDPDADRWITCDVAQYRYDEYDSVPYIALELPDTYTTFPDTLELGEKVLSDRDAEYCIGTVTENDYH